MFMSMIMNMIPAIIRNLIKFPVIIGAFALSAGVRHFLGFDLSMMWAFVPLWVILAAVRVFRAAAGEGDMKGIVRSACYFMAGFAAIALYRGDAEGLAGLVCAGAMFAATFYVVERYSSAQLAEKAATHKTKLWTGKATEESASDKDGDGRLRTPAELYKDPKFNVDPEKQAAVPIGVPVSDNILNWTGDEVLSEKAAEDIVRNGKLLYFNPVGETHLLYVAGTGSYKSKGGAIPAIIKFKGAIICLDPKGELFRTTSKARAELYGRKQVWISTVEADGRHPLTWSLDAMGGIKTGDSMTSGADNMAASLVPNEKSESGETSNWFAALAGATVSAKIIDDMRQHKLSDGVQPRPNIASVSKAMLEASTPELQAMFKEMVTRNRSEASDPSLPQVDRDSASDVVSKLAKLADAGDAETWEKIILSYHQSMSFLKDAKLARTVSGVGEHVFTLDELLDGKVDLYICLTAEDLAKKPEFARLILSTIFNAVLGSGERVKRAGGILAVLDEMSRLAKMPELFTVLELARSSGLAMMGFVQSIEGHNDSAGKSAFSRWMNNCDLVCFSGVGDMKDCEEVSKMLDERTILNDNVSQSTGQNGKQDTTSTKAQRVLTAGRVKRLPKYLNIWSVKGGRSFLVAKPIMFWRDDILPHCDLSDPKPPIEPTRDEVSAYRAAIRKMVGELYGSAKGDLDALMARAAEKVGALDIGHKDWLADEPSAESNHIPADQLFQRWIALHEALVNRPAHVIEAQRVDYERLTNRLVAEFAWALEERTRQAAYDAAYGVEDGMATDFLSSFAPLAPRATEMVLEALVAKDDGELEAILHATKDYPRAVTVIAEGDFHDDQADVEEAEEYEAAPTVDLWGSVFDNQLGVDEDEAA